MSQDDLATRAVTTAPLCILAPWDGSEAGRRGIRVTAVLPASSITLLRVVDDAAAVPAAEAELEEIAAPLREEGRTVTVQARTGDAASEIIAAGRDHDLIVMTARGSGGPARLLFGSVADRVTRHGETPTMLVRVGKEADSPLLHVQRVVVPLDGSAQAERALPMATTLAAASGVPVHLVQAVGLDEVRRTIRQLRRGEVSSPSVPEDHEASYEEARQRTESAAAAYLNQVAETVRAGGATALVEVLPGDAAFVLLWNIAANDIVVITSHGVGGFRQWLLGSVADKLVREAASPVVLVPTREPAVAT